MHYRGHLRDAFVATLEDYLVEKSGALDGFWYDEATQRLWDGMSPEARLRWIAGKLWWCTDVLPGNVCELIDLQPGSTYAQAAWRVRQGFVRPLRSP